MIDNSAHTKHAKLVLPTWRVILNVGDCCDNTRSFLARIESRREEKPEISSHKTDRMCPEDFDKAESLSSIMKVGRS
ncbi:hypothetical protein TNCV_2718631 [Trichonephila clavipes]|nr:hypothetical protein TNCV_2718631 [Trichonephila clavipes]